MTARRLLILLGMFLAPLCATPARNRDDAFINYSEVAKEKQGAEGCRDLDSTCAERARNGDCTKGTEIMHQQCKLSCGLCAGHSPPPVIAAADAKPKASSGLDDLLIVFDTKFGKIPIQPYWDTAPQTTALVLALVRKGCDACNFYRNEAVPDVGSGPPYGLLQGNLRLGSSPPRENLVPMGPRMVGFIGGTGDFFIAVCDHTEWGGAFSVWGEVLDMAAVHAMLKLPYHESKHPEFGTIMRMMNSSEYFNVLALPRSEVAISSEDQEA